MKNKAVLMVLFLLIVSLTTTMVLADHTSNVTWDESPAQF